MSIQIIGNQPGLAIDVRESLSLHQIRGKGADWGFREFSESASPAEFASAFEVVTRLVVKDLP